MATTTYRIKLQLFYVHSDRSFEDEHGNDNFIDETKLSIEELDTYMNSFTENSVIPRYMRYAQKITDILTKTNNYRNVENYPFDIEYKDNGILEFSTILERERTTEDIKREILMDTFEDELYEGKIGNEYIVPTRQKYPVKYYNPEATIQFRYSMEYLELGKIDCRAGHCIYVQKIY